MVHSPLHGDSMRLLYINSSHRLHSTTTDDETAKSWVCLSENTKAESNPSRPQVAPEPISYIPASLGSVGANAAPLGYDTPGVNTNGHSPASILCHLTYRA